MQLTFLYKAFCTLSVMAMFTAVVGTTVLQSAQAQSTRPTSEACPKSATKASATVASQPTQTGTVVDVAASNSSFTTLVQAVKAAELVETLSGKGPFTVFAPTNEAFAALPEGTLETLLKPENQKILQKILTYHVVSGNVLSKDLRSGQVTTVEGNPVTVQVQDSEVKVNNANVVRADISGSNGVVHVIDQVILPPDLKL
jgi:uncharacterized surface protein with fasciclin (FAS1) repeats